MVLSWVVALALVVGNVVAQEHLRRPSGQPYWSPDETVRRCRVPEGFELHVFAGEPDLANPIAMAFDSRGRLWVVECFEYPKGAPAGQRPRDRVKILEDTDGDHRADRIRIFAEGFDLATGLAVGYGGVFLGVAPRLLFLKDLDGDDRADEQQVLLTGFGRHDTHELLNTFTWGPDGWLYGLHGVFTRSEVQGIYLDAAVWRYHPRLQKFELFAEGTSNPWGIDFDSRGRMFLTACVIPHLFYMLPGGRYIRQAGQNRNPYDYGQLPQISDHLHHEESGWAHAGCVVLEGSLWPESWRGSVIFGSIHGSSIKRDILEPRGSGFVARHADDLFRFEDRNVRPVNLQIGPDGSLYITDWHDQWPCHQTPPDLWDKERGRIYKLAPKGKAAIRVADLEKVSVGRLMELLGEENPWWYRMALRVLAERPSGDAVRLARHILRRPDLGEAQALRALWAVYVSGGFDQAVLQETLESRHEWVRAWAIRLAVDGAAGTDVQLERTDARRLATDSSVHVRLALAAACQRVADGRWVDEALRTLALQERDLDDPNLPLMLWFALEPRVVADPDGYKAWMSYAAGQSSFVTRHLVGRILRRLAEERQPGYLELAVDALRSLPDSPGRLAGLQGMAEALRGRRVELPRGWPTFYEEVRSSGDPDLRWWATRVGVSLRHPAAVIELGRMLRSDFLQNPDRQVEAVELLALDGSPQSLQELQRLAVDRGQPSRVRHGAFQAMARSGAEPLATWMISLLRELEPEDRQVVLETLASREGWASALLDALAKGEVSREWVSSSVAERIVAHGNEHLRQRLEKLWGTVRRHTAAEMEQRLAHYRAVVRAGPGDPMRGREIYRKKCSVCHTFRGEGHQVGPDITGADRSVDYLLINIVDPNRVVGLPYFQHVIATKDGQVWSGKLIEQTPQRIVLEMEEGRRVVVPREEIDEHVVREVSVMPEGLLDDLSEQDVRDLVEYLRR